MGVKKLVKKLILVPKRTKESTDTTIAKPTEKRGKYGFGPLKIKLANNATAALLCRLTKSLQWSNHNNNVVVAIEDSKASKHYDYRGYDLPCQGPNAATEKQRTLFYGALGQISWTNLVIHAGNHSSPNPLLYAMVRLSDLSLCLFGGWNVLESLTLTGLVLVANQEEVHEFSKTLRGMNKLRSLKIDQCSLVIVDKIKRGARVEGWDPILRALSMVPSLEELEVVNEPDIGLCPLVQSTLQTEAGRLSHRMVVDTLSQNFLESLLLYSNRPKQLKDLRLSFVWNETNEMYITSFLRAHRNIETLRLTLRDRGDGPCFSNFLQALTVNHGLKHLHVQAPTSIKPVLDSVDTKIWKRLREQNKTLQELDISPEKVLARLVHATNDVWLELNRTGCFLPDRVDDNNALFWTHVLSQPRVYEDPTLLYKVLSKVQPLVIHP